MPRPNEDDIGNNVDIDPALEELWDSAPPSMATASGNASTRPLTSPDDRTD